VVHQLLDFMYGYVSGVLQDAEVTGPGQMEIADKHDVIETCGLPGPSQSRG
jgi:hypothetical protein